MVFCSKLSYMSDLHQKWPHRWLNPKAKSFDSPLQGLGVVAVDNIKKGETILMYGGIIVPKNEIEEYWKIMGHSGIQIEEDFFIVPTSREELEKTGIVNHSCEPNAGFKSPIELVAMRNIRNDEEITFDYAFCESHMESFDCNCGSSNCRKKITKADWKLKELQEKYKNYFSPYLKRKVS